MRFFYSEKPLKPGQKSGPLFTAISTYMISIDMGDYNPTFPDANWSSEEELICIQQLLNHAPEHFEGIEVPCSLKATVPHIANLLASLTILKESPQVAPPEKLKTLKDLGILTQVKAGMPGPCMIYIDALLHPESGCDNISKIMSLTEVINDLNDKGDKFGGLNDVVIFVAIDEWFSLLDTLDVSKRDLFRNEETDYNTIKAGRISRLNAGENTTFIDQCIIKVWEDLGINTGLDERIKQMNLPTLL